DIVIDNLAPFGDSTMELEGGIGVGAVSSITAAFIAQRITIGVAETIRRRGKTPPVYISANIPGGDEHNRALEDLYGERVRREARVPLRSRLASGVLVPTNNKGRTRNDHQEDF